MTTHTVFKNKPCLFLMLLCLGLLFSSACFAQQEITKYKKLFGLLPGKDKPLLVTRQFEQKGKLYYIIADPGELSTSVVPAGTSVVRAISWEQARESLKDTPYMKAIADAEQLSASMQDAGIIHGFAKEKGITLTVDLCPSHKPLDRVIFTSLITEFQKTEKPVPIALSVTGRWMLTHSDDLNWLKGLVRSGDIAITWVDHSYNHRVSPKAPLKLNFLLEPGTDMNFEILGTELAMLQHGLTPSLFFRFPGLVSDKRIVDQVLSYGLIPVGSDAWLAKGQQANSGSIVLIHGNGNEPVGVEDFIRLLKNEKNAVQGKQWMMYDLRESVENEFEQK